MSPFTLNTDRRIGLRQIEFRVHGIPAPQGSKTPYGTEANPRTRPWRATVTAAAHEAMRGQPPFAGPLELDVAFFFPHPKSHYRSGAHADELKTSAPWWVDKKPDVDKLVRAIGDALTGVVCRDDAQFVKVTATKRYGPPQAVVDVRQTT